MLAPHHLALFLSALAAAKLALIDRRAPYTTMGSSAVFFAGFAMASFSVEPLTGGEPRTLMGAFVLGLGGTLLMIGFLVLESIDALPDTSVENALGQHPSTGERGPPDGAREDPRQRGD